MSLIKFDGKFKWEGAYDRYDQRLQDNKLLGLLDATPHFLKLDAERYPATLNNRLIDSLVIGI